MKFIVFTQPGGEKFSVLASEIVGVHGRNGSDDSSSIYVRNSAGEEIMFNVIGTVEQISGMINAALAQNDGYERKG